MDSAAEQGRAPEPYALYIVRCEGIPRIPVPWTKAFRPIYAKFETSDGQTQRCDLRAGEKVNSPILIPAGEDVSFYVHLYADHRVTKDERIATEKVQIQGPSSEEFCTIVFSPTANRRDAAELSNTSLTFHLAGKQLDDKELDALLQAFTVPDKWSRMVDCVKPLAELGKNVSEVNPIAKAVMSVLEMGVQKLDFRLKRLNAIHDLLDAIADASKRVNAHAESHFDGMRRTQAVTRDMLLREIYDIVVYLRPLSSASAARRSSSQVEARIKEFRDRITTFMHDFEVKGHVDTQVAVFTVLEEMRLDKLPYARGVRAEPSKGCLPGTRVKLLQDIREWALSPDANRVCILQGTAGRGKTAIAHTVALSLEDVGVITPFFAFNRYDQERAAHQLFPTLARQLAERNKLYSQYLCDQPPSQLESRDPATQVQCIIRGGLGDCTVGAPIVFVLDALDECPDERRQAKDRRSMLEHLRNCLIDSRLPSNVRFFLTYRPDEDIIKWLAHPSLHATQQLSIDQADGTDDDIRAFVEYNLANTSFSNEVGTVTDAAQTLFQSAASLCLELTRVSSPKTVVFRRELIRRTKEKPGKPLYATYRAILDSHFDATDRAVMSAVRQLLGWVFSMRTPQPYTFFQRIANVHLANTDDFEFVTFGLGSLLTGIIPGSTGTVQPLHTSFRDFIFDTAENHPFFTGHTLAAAHAEVAYACLRFMNDPIVGLRFNILQLPRSFVLKRHIHDLEQRVSNHISPALRYACEHTHAHFSRGAIHSSGLPFVCELIILLKRNFLFWLETCSWIGQACQPAELLQHISRAAQRSKMADLHNFAVDCIKFEGYFGEGISQSPLQVYISSLKFAPRNSRVGGLYRARFFVPIDISGRTRLLDWPVTEPKPTVTGQAPHADPFARPPPPYRANRMVLDTSTMPVIEPYYDAAIFRGLAFAPNGQILASLSSDGTIHIRGIKTWDSRNFELWKSMILFWWPMAFSPDSKFLALADMWTVQLWDVADCRCIAQLRSYCTSCIAYSPDGKHIAYDTLRNGVWVWDLETGHVAQAESAHGSRSETSSTDGRTLTLISRGGLPQVWSLQSLRYIPSRPFDLYAFPESARAERRSVSSTECEDAMERTRAHGFEKAGHPLPTSARISLDPDQESDDEFPDDVPVVIASISLMDPCVSTLGTSREADLRPKLEDDQRAFEQMTCVTFSLDGKRVAGGSLGGTVRIWDAETLAQVGDDIQWHLEKISSIAFSPDRKRVASGSRDGAVTIWDADSQRQWGDVLRLHTLEITCVVFSSDGRIIVTGSVDCTVRIWNTVEERQLEHHLALDHPVICVAISPDALFIACGCSGDPNDGVQSVVFSSDGGRVAYCSNLAVHVLDMETRRELGRYVVFGSSDNCVGVWNTSAEGERACTFLHGPTTPVRCVASSRHGTTVLSCSDDPFIRLWDLALLPSPSSDNDAAGAESEMATPRLQSHIREGDGWLYHINPSPSNVSFLWIPPRLRRRFIPHMYSPAAKGVISAYSPFAATLANEKCIDEWAITYEAPPDDRLEQEDEDDEGEDVIDTV